MRWCFVSQQWYDQSLMETERFCFLLNLYMQSLKYKVSQIKDNYKIVEWGNLVDSRLPFFHYQVSENNNQLFPAMSNQVQSLNQDRRYQDMFDNVSQSLALNRHLRLLKLRLGQKNLP